MTKLGVVVLLSPGERRSGSGGRTSRELTDVPQVLRAQTVINDWNDIYTTKGRRTAATAGELPPPSPLR
jgi:hypothetical protein